MERYAFSGIKLFLVAGIIGVVIGVLLLAGLLKSRSGALARIIGGAVLIAFGILFINLRSFGEVRFTEGAMRLKVPFQRDKVIAAEEIVSAREINITLDGDLRPARKLTGGKVGDIRTGWFRLANGTKAFLALEGVRALYIETTLGFPVIAGVEDFEAFEESFGMYVWGDRMP